MHSFLWLISRQLLSRQLLPFQLFAWHLSVQPATCSSNLLAWSLPLRPATWLPDLLAQHLSVRPAHLLARSAHLLAWFAHLLARQNRDRRYTMNRKSNEIHNKSSDRIHDRLNERGDTQCIKRETRDTINWAKGYTINRVRKVYNILSRRRKYMIIWTSGENTRLLGRIHNEFDSSWD